MWTETHSPKETRRLGSEFIKKICAQGPGRHARVLALRGDLGSGKTTFVKGALEHFGSGRKVKSPTFILIRRYTIKHPRFKNIFHMDAYRLTDPSEAAAIGLEDLFASPQNIILIEWAENIRGIMPRGTIWLNFEHGRDPKTRSISK